MVLKSDCFKGTYLMFYAHRYLCLSILLAYDSFMHFVKFNLTNPDY